MISLQQFVYIFIKNISDINAGKSYNYSKVLENKLKKK